MNEAEILRLAKEAGLSPEWTDANGRLQKVAPEALCRILGLLEFPCASEEQCRESEARLRSLKVPGSLPPLVTGTQGRGIPLPPVRALAGKRYRIELENGDRLEGNFHDDIAALELPAIHSYGYHRLLTDAGETLLAVAPPRCFGVADAMHASLGAGITPSDVRLSGLGVQLYSLRRERDGGIGDFTALAAFVRRAAELGSAAVAISPVHAMFSADVNRFSPYGPSSRLFLNVLHIDPANVLGDEVYQSVLDALGTYARDRLAHLEGLTLIDWPEAARLRLVILRKLYERFVESGTDRGEFETFRKQGSDALRDHARFEAMHAWRLANGENAYWREWPDEFRDPHGAGIEAFAREHAGEIEFHEFLQWQAARGLAAAQKSARDAGMPIGLIADLAVGADNGGSQAWSRQKEIIRGLSVGAPPDTMNPRGQAWGLGAFSPQAMKAQGFRAYIEMLRAAFTYAGGVRIDHVLGLSRLWLVPNGESPENGAYLHYPVQDLLRLIALESWRHRAIVIGEDLGTVPAGFDRQIADEGLLGIRVLLFQRDGNRFLKPSQWSNQAIATTTTHDLPTLAGWWEGRDLEWRAKLDLLEKGQTEEEADAIRGRECELLWRAMRESGFVDGQTPERTADAAPLDAAVEFMSASSAPLAMLPVEDALGLSEQPNLPGTVDSHPNWRRRMPHSVDSLFEQPEVARRLGILNRNRHY